MYYKFSVLAVNILERSQSNQVITSLSEYKILT